MKNNQIKLIIILLLLLQIFSCSHNREDSLITLSQKTDTMQIVETEGFILISKEDIFLECKSKVEICVPFSYRTNGSGALIKIGNSTKVLTAGHVCYQDSLPKNGLAGSIILGRTINDNYLEMEIIKYNMDWDLCLLEPIGKFKEKPYEVADIMPKTGIKVANVAAPNNFFQPNLVPIFDGYYSGDYNLQSIYTIFSMPGSSGSPILDKENKIIGILTAYNKFVKNISYSPKLEYIHDFIFGQ